MLLTALSMNHTFKIEAHITLQKTPDNIHSANSLFGTTMNSFKLMVSRYYLERRYTLNFLSKDISQRVHSRKCLG